MHTQISFAAITKTLCRLVLSTPTHQGGSRRRGEEHELQHPIQRAAVSCTVEGALVTKWGVWANKCPVQNRVVVRVTGAEALLHPGVPCVLPCFLLLRPPDTFLHSAVLMQGHPPPKNLQKIRCHKKLLKRDLLNQRPMYT